jgi:hypothetical protein
MKTKNFFSVILICAVFGSCSSTPLTVVDESIPPEQRSRLEVEWTEKLIGDDKYVGIIVYDNMPVVWGPGRAYAIPSGKHSFLVKYEGRGSGGETAGAVAGFAGDVALTLATFGLWGYVAAESGGFTGIGGVIGSGIDDAVAAARSRAATEAALKAAEEAAGGTGLPVIIVMGLPSGYLTAPIPNTEFAPKKRYKLREPGLLRRDWIN